jgi:hypothetical protein
MRLKLVQPALALSLRPPAFAGTLSNPTLRFFRESCDSVESAIPAVKNGDELHGRERRGMAVPFSNKIPECKSSTALREACPGIWP